MLPRELVAGEMGMVPRPAEQRFDGRERRGKMPELVSLFSGLGGLDLGLEGAGWECVFATDIDPRAIESLRANQGFRTQNGARFLEAAQIECGDIRDLSGDDILARAGRRRGEITLLAGGPPCQSWSSAGHQLGFGDPRGQLIGDYLRVASELDTRFLLFENVRGLVTARGPDGIPGSALSWLREELFARGWQTQVELLNAADYGVPQRRVRVVLVGFRTGDAPNFPAPTHARALDLAMLPPWRTLGSCLAELELPTDDEIIRPTGKLADELAIIPAGSGVKSPGKREATRPGGHWGYRQGAFIADLDIAARTVTANSQQDWIRDPKFGLRKLSPRECAAIQTFPPGWAIAGKRSDQYRLVGNAVPPLLANIVGSALLGSCETADTQTQPWAGLAPLPDQLQSAIAYTQREEHRNGHSRKTAPVKRRIRLTA
jgi:DNA (cytosine-5)-methyltransferase 1